MNVAVIAEYNPFHNGHKYHIEKTKSITKANNIIAVMSGNFVQRGEPAMADKLIRTKMALRNGVDMVIELPVQYATGGADVFAGGAIDILNKSNIIDGVCFGSELGDITPLSEIADVLNNEPEEFKKMLKTALDNGINYPAARALALSHYLNTDISFLNSPNNILALEYVRALKRSESNIWPYTVKRVGEGYNSEEIDADFASATAIRQALYEGKLDEAYSVMPEECENIISNEVYFLPTLDDYSDAFLYIMRAVPLKNIADIADITEGLENRIYNNMENRFISDIINVVKTKRYTHTKIQRAILHIILGITKQMQRKSPEYIRVLGFRKEKEHLLSELSRKSSLPVVTNIKSHEKFFETEVRATDLYYMLFDGITGREYTNPVIVE